MKPNHEFRLVFAVATAVGIESYMTEAML